MLLVFFVDRSREIRALNFFSQIVPSVTHIQKERPTETGQSILRAGDGIPLHNPFQRDDSMKNSKELELLKSERGCHKKERGAKIFPQSVQPPVDWASVLPQVVHVTLASTQSSSHMDRRQDVRAPSQPPGNNDLEGKWKIAVIPENCPVEGVNKDLSRGKNAQSCSLAPQVFRSRPASSTQNIFC